MKPTVDKKLTQTADRRHHAMPQYNQYGQLVLDAVKGDPDDCIVRKISPSERKILLLKWIYDHNGAILRDYLLGYALAVNDRTIRNDLHNLVKEGFIRREEVQDKNGGTLGVKYYYVKGFYKDFIPFVPTIKKAHSKNNSLGLRDWLWVDYKWIQNTYDIFHTKTDQAENWDELKSKKKKVKEIKLKNRRTMMKTLEKNHELEINGNQKIKHDSNHSSSPVLDDISISKEIQDFLNDKRGD